MSILKIVSLLLSLLLLSRPAACCTRRAAFHAVLTSNCVSPAHYQRLDLDDATCAYQCAVSPRCRAFAMEAVQASDRLLCLLFSLDACSSQLLLDPPSSWDGPDGCASKKLRVFVKQSEGLEPGRLCPTDYKWTSGVSGSRFKASLYKAAGSRQQANWSAHASSCRSRVSISDGTDMPLTKLADLTNVEETKDMRASTGLNGSEQIWVGASALNNLTWFWADCSRPLPQQDINNGGVWGIGAPNDSNQSGKKARVVDDYMDDTSASREYFGVCECMDPFWYFTV